MSTNKNSKRRRTIFITIGVLLIAIGSVIGANYDRIAIQAAPKKQATSSRTEESTKASNFMWQTLHGGDYEKIPQVLTALTSAYLRDPNDAVTASHIGFMHMWRLVERVRLDNIPPTIMDHAVLARRYFQEAVALNPADARYLGFLGSATLAEGGIHRDQRIIRRGYFMLKDAIKAWPEFNLFTAGYSLSRQPADSPQFKEALDYQWRNVDACAKQKMNRQDPDFSNFSIDTLSQGDPRACGNGPIAPHNWEGFFLNLGDMLVKSGDWQDAQKAYRNAQRHPAYASWTFRNVLEQRIEQAEANVALFNQADNQNKKGTSRPMIASEFACVACHMN